MAQKPPEEGYISVVDESEPELLELLRWEGPGNQKAAESVQCNEQQVGQSGEQKGKAPAKKDTKPVIVDIDPFDLPEPDFIEAYRLSKDYFHKLCEELQPVMPTTSKVGTEVSIQNKLLSALGFFASGTHANRRTPTKNTRITDPNLPMYLAHQAVLHVIQALNHPSIVNKYIHFPHLSSEREDLKARFYMKYGMPNVIGCIDCVHVPVTKNDDEQKSHFNKSYHSKKVQLICDSSHNITSVHPLGGSLSHDTLLSRHAVIKDLESLHQSGEHCFLLGSAYYSARPYLMTPIPKITKKSADSPEKFFNALHAHTHSAIMVTIRQLKSRWKCLQTSHKFLDHNMMSMMIVGCCVLHNMCNARGLPITPMTPAEERLEVMKQKVANGPITKKPPEDEQCIEMRKQLMERVWSERRVVPQPAPPQEPAKKPKKRMTKKERLLQGYQNTMPANHQQQLSVLHLPNLANRAVDEYLELAKRASKEPVGETRELHAHQEQQMMGHHSQQQVQSVQLQQEDLSKRARMDITPPVYITHGMWNHYQPHPHHTVVDVNNHRYVNK